MLQRIQPQLADPLKVVNAGDALLHQLGHHILRVDLDDDESREHSPLHLG